jgi:hypothetical protein
LPEELKDLGWRDGVTLDPFRDFDTHLARLLSDLERVLEISRLEKQELLLARKRLIAMLRWRSRELERAAAREAAAKLAAERADKERAATEEWNAQRFAAAAATESASREKAESARAIPQSLTAFPGEPSPKATTPAEYYSGCNYYTVGALAKVFCSGWLVTAPLSLGYSYVLVNLPFVQLNFIFTLLYGILSGIFTGALVNRYRVRKPLVVNLVSLLVGLSSVYSSWVVWIYAQSGLYKTVGTIALLQLGSKPGELLMLAGDRNLQGVWSIWGYKPTGLLLWILWALEGIVISCLTTAVASLYAEIFGGICCEFCGAECQSSTIERRWTGLEAVRRHLEAKGFAFIEVLGPVPLAAKQWLEFELRRCFECGGTHTLSARSKPSEAWERSIWNLLVSFTESDTLQGIWNEAKRSTRPSI